MSDTLLNEIRATRPEAPSALRERVRALSVEEPTRESSLERFRFTWGWRRTVLAVPATLVVALLAAGVIGLSRDGSSDQAVSGDADANALESFGADAAQAEAASPPSTRALAPTTKDSGAEGGTVAPAPGQLQRFEAELSLRVDDVGALSDATKQAQRRIAQILAQLGNPSLADENRVVLQSRLASNREKLTGLREAMKSTRADAATSTVYLTLTTEEIQATPVGGSRLDDVKDVLAWEAIALLYVLVVAGPFVIIGVLVWLLIRLLRRRETARLLEQN